MLLILQWQLKEKEKLQAALKIKWWNINCLDERKKIIYTDEKVGMSMVTIADVNQSNGLFTLLMLFVTRKFSFTIGFV
jgi:hypothetical protein